MGLRSPFELDILSRLLGAEVIPFAIVIADGEWFRTLFLPATAIAILSLGWAIWKHFNDRAERRAEAERAREERIGIKHITEDESGPSLTIRVGNEGTRPLVLETAAFLWKSVDSDSEPTARALPATTWCAGRLDSDAPMAVPIEPGRTRNFSFKIFRTQREVAQLTSAVRAKAIRLQFITENRRIFEFGANHFGDALLQLLTRLETGMRRERIEPSPGCAR